MNGEALSGVVEHRYCWLVFGVPSDTTRMEFERKCDKVKLYCLAIEKLGGEGEYFRVTLKQRTSKKGEDRQEKWTMHCAATGTANLRRSPQVNRGKRKKESASFRRGKEEGNGGPNHTKTEPEPDRKMKQRDNKNMKAKKEQEITATAGMIRKGS